MSRSLPSRWEAPAAPGARAAKLPASGVALFSPLPPCPFMQGAKESPGRMAGGARMACQGPLGLLDTQATWEKPAALEPQVKSFSFSSLTRQI